MINWKDEYCTGVSLIDEQHQKLFEIANNVYLLISDNISIDKYDKLIGIIQELKDYTVFHFRAEEEYMQKVGYKKFFSHKVMHDDFIEKINGIDLEELDESQEQYIIEIMDFIVDWISNHILVTDKKIVENSTL